MTGPAARQTRSRIKPIRVELPVIAYNIVTDPRMKLGIEPHAGGNGSLAMVPHVCGVEAIRAMR